MIWFARVWGVMAEFLDVTLGEPLPGDPPCRATVVRLVPRGEVVIIAGREFAATSEAVRWARGLQRQGAARDEEVCTIYGRPGIIPTPEMCAVQLARMIFQDAARELRECGCGDWVDELVESLVRK